MTDISQGQYANFGQRFAAFLIDTIPLLVLQWLMGYFIGQSMADDYANGYVTLDEINQKATAWGTIIGIALSWLYFSLFESSEKQATPGKMVVGLTVTDLSGDRVSFGQATGRHFARIISAALLIGYLMPLWTQKRQALHDIISGCLIEQGGAKAVKSECDITPDLESLQGGELDSKAQASSGSSSQLNRAYQSKTALSAADLVRLEQITSLRDRGTLSQSQFETERDNILGAAEPISQAADAPPAISPPPPPLLPTTLPPPPPPPPAISSTAAPNVPGTNGANVIFIIVMLLLLSIATIVFIGLTQSKPDEAAAIASDSVGEAPSTVSDAESPSIDSNAVSADASVANCYGSYERENWSAAFVYCAAAAEQGDVDAQTFIGWMYAEGRGVAKDGAEAVRWYRKAAEQGVAQAQNNLGTMYGKGDGVAEDNAEALRWFRKAADQGFATAQTNVGYMYNNGEGVSEDNAEALRWFRKAAGQGDVDGQYNLGTMYDYGEGVVEDDAEAARWYRKAAGQGDVEAKKRLAELGY